MISVIIVDYINFNDSDRVVEDCGDGSRTVDRGIDGVIGWCGHCGIYRWYDRWNKGLTIDSP